MKETVAQLILWLLGAFAVYAIAFTVRWHWRKLRYGCSRCYYRRTIKTLNGPWTGCTASCGNQKGKTCGAWFYKAPEEDGDE